MLFYILKTLTQKRNERTAEDKANMQIKLEFMHA